MSRSGTKQNVTKCRYQWPRQLLFICGLTVVLVSQMASGMPIGPGATNLRVSRRDPPADNGNVLSSSPTQNEREFIGYSNDHPLNRRQQKVVSVAVPSAPVVTMTAPVSVAPVQTSHSVAVGTAIRTITSTVPPIETPVSSNAASVSSIASSSSTSTNSSIFSTHNKLFPFGLAAIVGMVFGAMIIIITLVRCIIRARMSPEEKAGEYSGNARKKSNNLARRSVQNLRGAFTRSKLGSFARRNEQGSVLIDVGDEVVAVTPEVAREYERERNLMGSGTSSSGSGLTSPSNSANSRRQALQNAQMTVAANRSMINGQSVEPFYTMDNISLESLDPKRTSMGISQRVTDELRGIRSRANDDELNQEVSANRTYSFDSERQDLGNESLRQAEVPPTAYLPIVTRGAKEWDIQPQRQEASRLAYTMQSNGSQSSFDSLESSHEMQIKTAVRGQRSNTSQYATNQNRPKSILIKRDEHGNQIRPDQQNSNEGRTSPNRPRGARRIGTISSSTSPASPRVLQGRSGAFPSTSPPLYMRPAMPLPAQNGSQNNSPRSSPQSLVRNLSTAPPSYRSADDH